MLKRKAPFRSTSSSSFRTKNNNLRHTSTNQWGKAHQEDGHSQEKRSAIPASCLKGGISGLVSSVRTEASDNAVALPKRARIVNQSVIDACRRDICEICGQTAGGEPHHIISRGAGGPDAEANLIQLCGTCHRKAHNGKLPQWSILCAVAARLRIMPDDVMGKIKEEMGRE